jgi:Right handed beta helix region
MGLLKRRSRASIARACVTPLVLAASLIAAGPIVASEVFVQPGTSLDCPCGRGQPPPLPCGASRWKPLACFEDAYGRASTPGDTVTLLGGTYETCPDLDRDGTPERPFTYRAGPDESAVIHCSRDRDALVVGGSFNVLEGIRIVSDTTRNAGVRIGGPSEARAGRNTLRHVSIQGHQAGVAIEGRGGNRLEGVVVRAAGIGVDLHSSSNTIRDLDVMDANSYGVWIEPDSTGNTIEGGRIEESGATGILIDDRATDTTIAGVKVLGAHGMAVNVRASRVTLRRCEIARAGTHGVEVYPLPVPIEALRIEDCDIHDNSGLENGVIVGDGVKLISVVGAVVTGCHIHHNSGNGVLEGAHDITVENCEIDHNGHGRHAHGIYSKAIGAVTRGCRIHDNSGYGLHLWAAPVGYLAEDNEVYRNGWAGGGGIVVGGSYEEAPQGGTGYPVQVVVRHNHVWGNLGRGIYYLISPVSPPGTCHEGASGNAFVDNLIETLPGMAGIDTQGDAASCLTIERNLVRSLATPEHH